jgi:hypothetical protein
MTRHCPRVGRAHERQTLVIYADRLCGTLSLRCNDNECYDDRLFVWPQRLLRWCRSTCQSRFLQRRRKCPTGAAAASPASAATATRIAPTTTSNKPRRRVTLSENVINPK